MENNVMLERYIRDSIVAYLAYFGKTNINELYNTLSIRYKIRYLSYITFLLYLVSANLARFTHDAYGDNIALLPIYAEVYNRDLRMAEWGVFEKITWYGNCLN